MMHSLRNFFSDSFTFSKRLLGVVMLIAGVGGVVALLALDFITGTTDGGIGPAQRLAIGVMALVALVGLTLIPLGDKPA